MNGKSGTLVMQKQLLTIGEAGRWASTYTGREVTSSNISYLVNYGRIRAERADNGATIINVRELELYYTSRHGKRESHFKQRLGNDLNWRLSFEEYKESETTKHVHRLHPYKGKFIPQLVEYFLDSHTDEYKTEALFCPGDVILDPFCGSGTTLVQAHELGIHAIGIDVSRFNTLIANLKLCRCSAQEIRNAATTIEKEIEHVPGSMHVRNCEVQLASKLKQFNTTHFPSSHYKIQLREGKIDESIYGAEKEKLFLPQYYACLAKFGISSVSPPGGSFMDTWYLLPVRREIDAAADCIDTFDNVHIRDLMRLMLSRTIRSCRATTHADLATLRDPMLETYYCSKHGKICKPLFSILGWWKRYAQDTVKRLLQFDALRTNSEQWCITDDARVSNVADALPAGVLADSAAHKNIRGIFSSPPYVGLINYHEQHAYAYELFNLPQAQHHEIGILEQGSGKAARASYINGVAEVLRNCRRFMVHNFDVFLVANDKFGMYPTIADKADMRIVKEYKRPVINRAEGNKGVYSESIFHLRRQ